MAELNTDIPTRFPHENQAQYMDRQQKYTLILERVKDEDDAAALSMIYSNMVYLNARYPPQVEARIEWIPEIEKITSEHRDDSAARIDNIMAFADKALGPDVKKKR